MRLAIVGAGKGGMNLIRTLSGLNGMEVAVVIDKSPDSPGMILAREKGIACATELEAIRDYRVETIIEATGVPQVQACIDELFQESHTIVHSSVAQVMMTVVEQHAEMGIQMGKQLEAINRASHVFNLQYQRLNDTVIQLEGVSSNLQESLMRSTEYIQKSDDLSQEINRIASHIKILGLNANIEAARAGEAGKGFAVVASEVQKMSNTSTQFATEISALLKSLNAEISDIGAGVTTLNSVSDNQNNTSGEFKNALNELTMLCSNC